MTWIQALLIAAICLLLVLYYESFKHQAIKRLLVLFLFLIGMVFVAFPDLANLIAHALGIGRGADLLLYFSIIGGFLVSILFYSKFKQMERNFTGLVRRQAILHARRAGENGDWPEGKDSRQLPKRESAW